MKKIVFLSAIFVSLLFFFSYASASNCEDIYGGGCALSCTDSYGTESLSLGSSSSFGCPLSYRCCVLPCEGATIRSRYSEATCVDKTSGSCEQELGGVLDCQSKIGLNGICCIKFKSAAPKGCCVKDEQDSSKFGPDNCVSSLTLGECGSYGSSGWYKSEPDCTKNTQVTKYCTASAAPKGCCVKDEQDSSKFGPDNCVSSLTLGECGSYGSSGWYKSEPDCTKNTQVTKYCGERGAGKNCGPTDEQKDRKIEGVCIGKSEKCANERTTYNSECGDIDKYKCCERVTLVITSHSYTGIVPCGENGKPCTLCDLIIGFHNLINWGKNILVTVTMVAIFLSGILYVVSTGSEKIITKAKSFLAASLTGFAITLAAWLIVNTVIYWAANAKPDLDIKITNWNTFKCE
jgi:hypothetical protein